MTTEGILLVNKASGATAFSLVSLLRKRLNVRKIGHAGTLDPLATGIMVMLIGSRYTTLSNTFLTQDKEYLAEVCLGAATDSYDSDGQIIAQSNRVPSLEEVESMITQFQGTIQQVPPMFSAKKQKGKKLYELARQGKTVHREPVPVEVTTSLLSYGYPYIDLKVTCSKGTYIRSIAHELGNLLDCGAHLSQLQRKRSGQFHLKDCIKQELLTSPNIDLTPYLLTRDAIPRP